MKRRDPPLRGGPGADQDFSAEAFHIRPALGLASPSPSTVPPAVGEIQRAKWFVFVAARNRAWATGALDDGLAACHAFRDFLHAYEPNPITAPPVTVDQLMLVEGGAWRPR